MKQIYKKRSFVIYRVRDGHIIYNTKKPFSEGHTHVSNYDTAIRIMNIAISKEVPRHLSDYLLESLIRLTDDEDFRIRIENMRENRNKRKGKCENMNFGEALEAVKHGKKISREGWNGKGLFVVYQKAYPDGIPCNKQTAEAWGMKEGDLFKCEPYLQINTVDGSHAMWVPSIRDVLAEDWCVVQ